MKKKNVQIVNAGEGVEKMESSYAISGNVNWDSPYGEEYAGYFKKN